MDFDVELTKEENYALKQNLQILLREKTPSDTERFNMFKKILIRILTAKI